MKPTSTPIIVRDETPSSIPGDGVTAHWYRPTREHARNACGIVCLPIQGGDYEVSTLFAETFTKRGFHTLRLERRAEWLDPEVPLDTLAQLVPRFVSDIGRAIDAWLDRDGAPTTIGLFGVSMGAMTGTLLAAADGRIQAQTLCIGGGELADILRDGRDTELDAWRDAITDSLGGPEAFDQAVAQHVTGIGVLDAAKQLDPDRTLFIGARFDQVVPWSASVRLWDAIGKPKRITLPTGHYSAVVGVPWIKFAATRHFDRWLTNAGRD